MTEEEITHQLARAISTSNGKALFDNLRQIHRDALFFKGTVRYPTQRYDDETDWIDFSVESNRVICFNINSSYQMDTDDVLKDSIRLGYFTDFSGFTFKITIDSSDPPTQPFVLFSLYSWGIIEELEKIKIHKADIDSGLFHSYSEIDKDKAFFLILGDRTPWSLSSPSGTPTYRKDIIFIENGVAKNRPISPYNTKDSDPNWEALIYVKTKTAGYDYRSHVKNVTLLRDKACTQNVTLLRVVHEDDVMIEDITVDSYNNAATQTLVHDYAIQVRNSTNIHFKNITINHVFSTETEFGYGINLDNVWNVTVDNLNLPYNDPAHPTPLWGVFGNNNVNTMTLTNCKLNRFDIHCYGRDVTCRDCTFEAANTTTRHRFNRLSSFFGSIRFDKCTFKEFVPVRVDPEFNAPTGFDIYFEKGCTLFAHPNKNFIVEMWYLRSSEINCRAEVAQKCLPNVRIDGLEVTTTSSSFTIYNFTEHVASWPIYYLSWLYLSGLTFLETHPSFYISNKRVTLANSVYLMEGATVPGHYITTLSNNE